MYLLGQYPDYLEIFPAHRQGPLNIGFEKQQVKNDQIAISCSTGYRTSIVASSLKQKGLCQCSGRGRRHLCLEPCRL